MTRRASTSFRWFFEKNIKSNADHDNRLTRAEHQSEKKPSQATMVVRGAVHWTYESNMSRAALAEQRRGK
jgi:hypothetical protein